MDCHRARRLLEDADAASETDRDAALEHLDGCAECAAIGPDLDPLLLFRRLPELAVSSAETARMREAVAVLRRAPADSASVRRAGIALRFAAAVVAVCALWLAPGPLEYGPRVAAIAPLADGFGTALPAARFLPSVETIGATDAYVATQINQDDLTLVILANVDLSGRVDVAGP